LQPTKTLLSLALALSIGACGRQPPALVHARRPTEAGTTDRGYVAPPELASVEAAKGGFRLSGAANPGARVRLATPTGEAVFAVADPTGVWRVDLAGGREPRLLGLSMSDQGRVIQAKGYLFLSPEGVAARLRAGGGSEALADPGAAFAVTAMDYDNPAAPAAGATLSGRAAPGDAVSVRVDGVERGQTSADARGRFVLPLNQPLGAGSHDFDLISGHGETELSAPAEAPMALGGAPFRASRGPFGWRIDWLTPGGGEQTTLVFAPRPGS
jgi:hypothetical protein